MHYIYIYAFSRRFYPKWLTVHSGYTFVLSVCGLKYWESPFLRTEKDTSKTVATRIETSFIRLKIVFPPLLQQVWKCLKWLYPYVQVIGVCWGVFGSRSEFKFTRGACTMIVDKQIQSYRIRFELTNPSHSNLTFFGTMKLIINFLCQLVMGRSWTIR